MKNNPAEPAEEEVTKPRKAEKSSSGSGKTSGIVAFFQDTRVKKIAGIFLAFFSVYLFLSCCSYLFSGGHDQHLIVGNNEGQLAELPRYANWMGKIGAHLAHFFMYRFFGVGAFFVAFMFFLYGARIAFNRAILPLFKSLRLSVLGMLYFPLLIGFLFHKKHDLPTPHIELTCNDRFVGGYGFFATQWTTFTLGWFGTLMLLVFVTGAFLIFNYNHQVEVFWARIGEWWQKGKETLASGDSDDEAEPVIIEPEVSVAEKSKNEIIAPSDDEEEIDDEVEEGEESEAAREVEEQELEIDFPQEIVATMPVSTGIPFETGDLGIEVQAVVAEEELPESEIEKRLKEFGEYDPKLDLSRYVLPSIDLLKQYGSNGPQITKEELEANKNKIVETLNQYKIEIARIKATIGPTVTLYEIVPAPGVRISKIKNLEDDIALSLAALGIRIIAPIPGKGTIGIEVPNSRPDIVSMRTLIASEKFQNSEMDLPVVLGKTISNEIFVTDLTKMPHLLMAGATGQGKSVGLNAILVSLLYKKHPSQIKLVLVDPKKVELTLFNKIERHFLAKLPDTDEPIITDTSKVV
ncbi:MAG: DNA translocase FtsK, partial [Crocinitomicaceae bacterium]|nr:DNA translocase FtsK [Crocinitomicaceae bacterium]